ncbi:MAG: OmpW/AlkL family protein [Limnohabitans sp.]|jgi:outer membrane protein
MKKAIVLATLAAGVVGAVQAQENPWLVRLRATHLQLDNKNGTAVPELRVSDKTIAEVDVSYFLDKNVAAELVLTAPQKHTVYAGATALGTFKQTPPTLLLQYHFTDLGGYKPYVGAGINYTRISSVNIQSGGVTLDSHSWGGALQAGVDIPLDRNWSLNFDVKKLYIRTDVYAGASNIGTLKLDPLAASIGIGYRY